MASWALMMINGKTNKPQRQPSRDDRAAVCGCGIDQAKDRPGGDFLQRPDKDRQPKDAVDDRRHPCQIVDIGLDQAVDPALIGVFFQVDRGANS